MQGAPSIRKIAACAGVSTATVSEALRNSPRVRPETRDRVTAIAAQLGYRRNPLIGEVMAGVRRARTHDFRSCLAAIGDPACSRLPGTVALLDGARERAAALGYALEWVPFTGRTEDVNRRIRELGAEGVILLPMSAPPDWSTLDWSRIAGVAIGERATRPLLSRVAVDPYACVALALAEARRLGYHRPALCLEAARDRDSQCRWTAGYLLAAGASPVPVLSRDSLDADACLKWYERHKPDVILGFDSAIVDGLTAAAVRVPADVGFIQLGATPEGRCAGVHFDPASLGTLAVDTVAGHVVRNERGVPCSPKLFAISGVWVDGRTAVRSVGSGGGHVPSPNWPALGTRLRGRVARARVAARRNDAPRDAGEIVG